ncbi:NepR family anti-sigma factor [Mesorhizobium sp. dw_380]|uniref:NepR family anti-sigma factor n=1 Tax=Mesorhizobium sp. dw_380 TaxID=2812001 RepID=UPI001BDDF42C|nr:NepR family anti-sigma factor [Mesorhizobium sp. dw_380]
MKTRNKAEKGKRLATEVRRQLGAEAMTRFLRTLPAFRIEADIPDRFRDLLDRLDRVENEEAGWQRQ